MNVTRAVTPSGLGRRERVVDRLVERLRRRCRAAAARGDGDRRSAAGECEHGDDENDQASGRKCAQVAHGDPFSCSSPSVVASDSERSLRARQLDREPRALDVRRGRRAARRSRARSRARARSRRRAVATPEALERVRGLGAARPGPSSDTLSSAVAVLAASRPSTAPRPWRRAFSTRFASARSSAARSPRTLDRPDATTSTSGFGAGQLVERDDLVRRGCGLLAREREQVVGESRQPARVLLELGDELGARTVPRQVVDVADERRQRRAQLVRRVGKEATLGSRGRARARSASRSACGASRPTSSSVSGCGSRRRGSPVRSISAAARASRASGDRAPGASAARARPAATAAATSAARKTNRWTLASVELEVVRRRGHRDRATGGGRPPRRAVRRRRGDDHRQARRVA